MANIVANGVAPELLKYLGAVWIFIFHYSSLLTQFSSLITHHLVTHTRLWNNRVMLLFTSSIYKTKYPYFHISFSSFSEFPLGSWCYLSIISDEKLIFFFEVYREFYSVGKVVLEITKVYHP